MRRRQPDRPTISSLLILLTMLACAVPGLSFPGAAPAGDPGSFSTIVAGTAAVLASQTAAAAPASTPTQAPTPAPQPTNTAAEVVSTEGTSLRKQADGSYLFSDYMGGYRLAVAFGWLAVRVNEQETMNAWALPEASNPNVQRFLTQVQASDPKLFRLFGLDVLPEHLQRSFATNFNVLLDRNNTDSLEGLVDDLKKEMPRTLLSARILSARVDQTSSQIPVGIIETTSDLQGTSGESISLYQKQVIFRVRGGALAIAFSTTTDLKDLLVPVFDQMIDRIEMLEQ